MDPPTYPFEETSFMDGPQANIDNNKPTFAKSKACNYTSVCKYATRGLATTIIYFYYGSQRGEKAKKGKKRGRKIGQSMHWFGI